MWWEATRTTCNLSRPPAHPCFHSIPFQPAHILVQAKTKTAPSACHAKLCDCINHTTNCVAVHEGMAMQQHRHTRLGHPRLNLTRTTLQMASASPVVAHLVNRLCFLLYFTGFFIYVLTWAAAASNFRGAVPRSFFRVGVAVNVIL